MNEPTNEISSHVVRDRVLEAITKKRVLPKPSWRFFVHEWTMRAVALGAFVLGVFATALSLYLADASRATVWAIQLSPLKTIFALIPFAWLLLFVLGVSYAVHAVRATRTGYRLHTGWLVGGAIGTSVFFGTLLYSAGVSREIDEYLLESASWYRGVSGFHMPPPAPGVFYGKIERDTKGKPFFHARGGMHCVVQAETLREGKHLRAFGTSTEKGCVVFEVREFEGRMGSLDADDL